MHPHAALIVLAGLLAAAPAASQAPAPAAPPLTTAEASGFTKTSTSADVAAFIARLEDLPEAGRLLIGSLGPSGRGVDMPLVYVADPPVRGSHSARATGKLRILVNANIHAGEIEGKTAAQMLLREFASGDHAEILAGAVLAFVPNFNPDGNDRFDRRNRRGQNGPTGLVGARPNAGGLDLNRDFIKAESPEVRGMLNALREFDPHVFMDLHTTNGSYHGYHLTYAPSLSTNVDPTLDLFARGTLLPAIRKAVHDDHGFRVFDYGNFPRRGDKAWSTYDHRPRFGTNYVGLRNRLSVLSEAYSYLDFERRVKVTRAFVLETLRAAVGHGDRITALCAAADERMATGSEVVPFLYDTALIDGTGGEVLVGSAERVEEGGRVRMVASEEFERVQMPVRDRFRSNKSVRLPAAWAISAASSGVVLTLLRHGIELRRLTQPLRTEVEVFVPSAVTRARRSFQGHLTRGIDGKFEKRGVDLPEGTVVISARQPLARVAAQLLEGHSEDSLTTWNAFDEALDAEPATYPVIRLLHMPELPRHAIVPVVTATGGGDVTLNVVCTSWGREEKARRGTRLVDHRVRWEVGPKIYRTIVDLEKALGAVHERLRTTQERPPAVLVRLGKDTTFEDLATTIESCRRAGFTRVQFVTMPR